MNRASDEQVGLRIKALEGTLAAGGPGMDALLDLRDARARIKELEEALGAFPSDVAISTAMRMGGATLRRVLDAYHRADVLRCRALRGEEAGDE